MIFDNELKKVQAVLSDSAGKTPTQLVVELTSVVSSTETLTALRNALKGDNRPLNELLYKQANSSETILVWIAPIESVEPKYVWMIGRTNALSLKVHYWFGKIRNILAEDPYIQQKFIPPPLLFVDPISISSVTLSEMNGEDEFAIFQTGYKETPDEVSDLNQKMVLNMKYSLTNRIIAQDRLETIFGTDNELVRCCRDNIELFSILHNEGHNQGHFVGSWPHEDLIKKNTVIYEAVEEFRACVAAVLIAQYLPLTELQKTAFGLSVFATRCLGFGFDAYCLTEQRRETVREIVVGLFFFEQLIKTGALSFEQSTCCAKINSDRLLESLSAAFHAINEEEKHLDQTKSTGLRKIATKWYKLAFPDGDYSQIAKSVYSILQERRNEDEK